MYSQVDSPNVKKMNFILRMSRAFVAVTLIAVPPVPAYAASAIVPMLTNNGGARPLPSRGNQIDPAARARASAGYNSLPAYFEKNHGQTDASVKFFSRTPGYNLYLTPTEAVMVLPPAKAAKSKGSVVVRMKLMGANANPSVRGRDILPGYSSYIRGNDRSKWQAGVEQYAKVEFSQVYPGIDMVYYGKQGHVEHDFVVAPGADPRRILMSFEGGKDFRLDAKGNLILSVEGGEVTYNSPTLYQMLGAKRISVNGRFVLAGNKQVRFEVGDYIRTKDLVIDPALGYSSFLGGTGNDYGYAIAVDASGNAYLTGSTASSDFPGTTGEYQAAYGGGAASNVFVTKINPAGTAILWSTYIGGTGINVGNAIAVDGAGKVYITGSTTVSSTFPKTASFGTSLSGTDAFLAAINSDGKSAVYVDVFGGPGTDVGNGIAVTPAGIAYVTGSTDNTFPVTGGAAQTSIGGMTDAFVAEFSAAGAQVYATYLGGVNADFGNAIAIDGSGTAYVTGQCGDAFVDASDPGPYAHVFRNTIPANPAGFIAVLSADGSMFTYKTYVGGAGSTAGTGIAVDSVSPQPNVYMTGWTIGSGFPHGDSAAGDLAGQTTPAGGGDAFVFKLHPFNTGGGTNDAVYATYLGGSGLDQANAIAVDSAGDAFVAGFTQSSDFPVTAGTPAWSGGTQDAFVTEIGPGGGLPLLFSTYLGGTGYSFGQGLALDGLNNIYVAGNTNSSTATFPKVNPFQAVNNGLYDAFVSKFGSSIPLPVCTINPLVPNSGTTLGRDLITITGTGFIGVSASTDVVFGGVNATAYTVLYSTEITATTPGRSTPGSVSFAVTTTSGTCLEAYTYVDVTPPTIAISSPTSGSFLNGTSTTAVIDYADAGGSGLNLSSLIVKLNGTPLASGITVYASSATVQLASLTQRSYTLDASIQDNAGNLTNAAQTNFTVDLTSPTIAIAAPPNGSFLNYTSTTAVIDYADAGGSGLNLSSLIVKLNGTPLASGITVYVSSATVLLASLTQRAYTLDASIQDNAGNLTNAAQTNFTVDLASPTIAIVAPPNGALLKDTSTKAVI